MSILFSLIAFTAFPSALRAASAISLAGVDFHKLCRDTAHVPLVQAAINPAYINVWSEQESRRAGRYEQYSFRTQRIDVRVEHDISLYHGLIHRTLDLIGESQWKHRDLAEHEDHEHWLIYHTLEMHWPGMQRRQGGEPNTTTLMVASDYWRQHSERYAEIAAKAAALAKKSWCANNQPLLEANVPRPAVQARLQLTALTPPSPMATPHPVPEPMVQAQPPRQVAPESTPPAQALPPAPVMAAPASTGSRPLDRPAALPPETRAATLPSPDQSPPQAAPPIQARPAPTSAARLRPPVPETMSIEPIWVVSEFLATPSAHPVSNGVSPWASQWASSPSGLPAVPTQ